MHGRRRLSATTALLACATAAPAALAGCTARDPGTDGGSAAVTVSAAPDGRTTACGSVVSRLPATVLDLPAREGAPPGVALWAPADGSLPPVVVRCGVRADRPTTDPCLEVDGIDWTFREDTTAFRFTTFGRSPAVEVLVPTGYERSSATGALVDIAPAVGSLPAERSCA